MGNLVICNSGKDPVPPSFGTLLISSRINIFLDEADLFDPMETDISGRSMTGVLSGKMQEYLQLPQLAPIFAIACGASAFQGGRLLTIVEKVVESLCCNFLGVAKDD